MKRRSTLGWIPLREEENWMDINGYYVPVQITFTREDIDWMRQKFPIEDVEDLTAAIWECVTTYMEM